MKPKTWLADISWEMVVWQNEQLCKAKKAHHGPTSDGYEACRVLWDQSQKQEMTFVELVDLCRRCHRMAPFTNYNGNTFAAIARALIESLALSASEAAAIRSLAGHIVAGVASEEEVKAFQNFCDGLE